MKLLTAVLTMLVALSCETHAACGSFVGSTMDSGATPIAAWRTDFPASANSASPWEQHSFETAPEQYLNAVLETARPHFKAAGGRFFGSGTEPWWISEWMDYDRAGREPLIGLTKERGPRKGDLSATSTPGPQIWAVGFYNDYGSTVLGKVFNDPCNPQVPAKVLFPEKTVSIKFLFTDANLGAHAGQVSYLDGAPAYKASIDPEGVSGAAPVDGRTVRDVQLLQVDIAVKDGRASKTGWVFGTYVWVGPANGDGLFDNLKPASLQWANDAGVYTTEVKETWVNPALSGMLSGWTERPFLGFNGRANGPADNIRSSCLSCHAAARAPRSAKGILGSSFNLADLNDAQKVKAHVDTWFQNIAPGETFDPGNPAAVSALDYSLQLESAFFRMCSACEDGAMNGKTPDICVAAGFYTQPSCRAVSLMSVVNSQAKRALLPLPRQ